ncbi:hypothetical protein SAMN05216178_2018 [Pseudomonas saponiphila]|uniref:DNA segregation ATPase FtsK/SpoIIIE, S-DNA-T family n=1 Tax=Pseudomonas saponiphila TaxID=556534 RepID=A0A1H4LPR9_9PSED|nr:hypothetical protein [Pseudomonas saponiphila]SEB72586.1 hypothetical protein SAMN05216178_2018 [Pseudomonas saponiphila]
MKLEHRSIIERCKREGAFPADVASQLLEHDLVQVVLDQLRGQARPYGDLSESAQQATIERVTLGVHTAVQLAIRVIASNGVKTVPVDVKRVQVDDKSLTVTAKVDGKDPSKHDLVDAAGHLCLLVMAPDDYSEALDDFVPDRDQKDLPLSIKEPTADLLSDQPANPDDSDGEVAQLGTKEDLEAHLAAGKPGAQATVDQEFGDFSYEDAAQLIVLKAAAKPFKAHWVQSRLAIDSDQATTLLLRLLDKGVIELETEGESALEHSYKVIATLEDVA